MLVYMVLFLFVVIGIFNLIMAVLHGQSRVTLPSRECRAGASRRSVSGRGSLRFLDSVLNDHVARELQELGYRSEESLDW